MLTYFGKLFLAAWNPDLHFLATQWTLKHSPFHLSKNVEQILDEKTYGIFTALCGASPTLAQMTVSDQLLALGVVLESKRPEVVASLRAPLSVDKIARLEAEYQIALPDAVKSLYLWHDGQDPTGFVTFVNNMTFLPLSEALQTKAELDQMIGYDFDLENWWHPAWLPLFHNGGGDYIVVDLAGIHTGNSNQVLRVYHDWEYRPILAKNLQIFLDATLEYYGTTPIEKMDEFHIIDEFLPDTDQSFDASGIAKPLK